MAIIDTFVSVNIKCAGRKLQEYDDDSEEPAAANTVTKYVEVESGTRFVIEGYYHPAEYPYGDDDGVAVDILVDGSSVARLSHERQRFGQLWRYSRRTTTVQGRTFHQHLTFAELQITEDAADQAMFDKVGCLGTITVKCYRAAFKYHPVAPQSRGPGSAPPPASAQMQPPSLNPREAAATIAPHKPLIQGDQISEKTLKGRAISYQAKLGEPTEQLATPAGSAKSRKSNIRRSTTLLDKEPFAVFHFKYRSLAALQALYIIPRSPSPLPVCKKPVNKLSRDGILSQAAKEEAKSEIKRELTEVDDDEGGVEFVEQRPSKRMRTAPRADEEVLDLCGED